jgi:hypothetical protein
MVLRYRFRPGKEMTNNCLKHSLGSSKLDLLCGRRSFKHWWRKKILAVFAMQVKVFSWLSQQAILELDFLPGTLSEKIMWSYELIW